jgi:hypothetical protein
MKFVLVPLLLLCSGLACDFTLLSETMTIHPARLFARLRNARHRHLNPAATHSTIAAAARKHNVPAAFVKSIVAAESDFDAMRSRLRARDRSDENHAGEGRGIWRRPERSRAEYRCRHALLTRAAGSLPQVLQLSSARHCGLQRPSGAVDRHRGIPPYKETRSYVFRVLVLMRHFQKAEG